MAAPSNSLFASRRRSKALGLVVAGGILFVIGIGGLDAFGGVHMGALSLSTVDRSDEAV